MSEAAAARSPASAAEEAAAAKKPESFYLIIKSGRGRSSDYRYWAWVEGQQSRESGMG